MNKLKLTNIIIAAKLTNNLYYPIDLTYDESIKIVKLIKKLHGGIIKVGRIHMEIKYEQTKKEINNE